MALDPALLLLIARVLIGGAFFVIGIRILLSLKLVAGFLAAKNIPYPTFVAASGAAIEIVLGALAIAGIALPAVSIGLALFVVAATLMGHDFWNQKGPQRSMELGTAISHLIMVGGLLSLAAASL